MNQFWLKKRLAAFVRMCTFYVQYDSDTVLKEHVLKIYQTTLQLSRYAYTIYLKSKNILGWIIVLVPFLYIRDCTWIFLFICIRNVIL